MPTSVVEASMDATAYGSSPTRNWSTQTYLTVAQGGDGRRPFVYFPNPVVVGETVVEAYVEFTQQRAAASASRTLNLEDVVAKWDERKLTWNNAPAVGNIDSFVTVTGAGSEGRVIRFDVKDHLSAVAAGAPWFGFRLTSSSSEILPLFSRESTVGKPRLVVTTSTAPLAPTRMSPSGGRAVSLARPTLSFDFTDTAGSTEMTGYRVQLFEPGFSSSLAPAVVSGKIVSYNVYGGYGGNWSTRLPQVVSQLYDTNADIILLQEAHEGPGEQTQILNGLNAAGRNYINAGGSGGNFIFLKVGVYAISEPVKTYRMPHSRDFSTMKVVHVPSGVVHGVWNTHLIANDQAKRSDQARFMVPIIVALGPSIGGGDLNNESAFAGSPLQQLALAGKVEARALVETVNNGTLRSKKALPFGTPTPADGKWIDHLFVAFGPVATNVGLVDTGTSSDHNLIYADFEMVTGALLSVDSLGAPVVDTGWASATIPQHTLTSDVALDTGLLWRVQVRDGDDNDSDWSEAAAFTRVAKPVVTIVNPAAAPDNYVSEATPPIIWSSTATVQTAYRVLITDPLDSTVIFWDSGRQGGADTSLTPSADLPLEVGRTYRLEVRVEDDVIREATPGDPAYAVAERLFTFDLSNTVTPVTSLVAVQDDERPWMTLRWTSTTAPDAFEILRDGVSLGTFVAADLHETGTTYAFLEREVSPLRDHTWEVRRIVNGVTGAGASTVGHVEAVGTWLSSVDGQHIICIADEGGSGDGPVRWEADEMVELIAPLGGDRRHVVTDAIFGRAGSLAGAVMPYAGQTLAQAREALEALRPPLMPYGTPMILTQVDECVRVFWVGVVADRRHEFGDWFSIAADLHEVRRGAA